MMPCIRKIVDSSFRRNHWGKLVFYPWGVFGKGYIVEDAFLSKRIHRFLTIYYVASFVVLIISSATVGALGNLVLVPVAFIIYPIKVHLWSRKMKPTLLRRRDAKPLNG
jgi:uncharacterized membrane protein